MIRQGGISADTQPQYISLNERLRKEYLETNNISDPVVEDEILLAYDKVNDDSAELFAKAENLIVSQHPKSVWRELFITISGAVPSHTPVAELQDTLRKLHGILYHFAIYPNQFFAGVIAESRRGQKQAIISDVQAMISRANDELREELASREKPTTQSKIRKTDAGKIVSSHNSRPESEVANSSQPTDLDEKTAKLSQELKTHRRTVELALPWINNGKPVERILTVIERGDRSVGYVQTLVSGTEKLSKRARLKAAKGVENNWFDQILQKSAEKILDGANPNAGDNVFKGRMNSKHRPIKDEFDGIPIFYAAKSGSDPLRIYVGYCDTRNSSYSSDKVKKGTILPDIILFGLIETDKRGQTAAVQRLFYTNRGDLTRGAGTGSSGR